MQKILAVLVFFFLLIYFPVRAYADEDFSISSSTTYSVNLTGVTQVKQNILIKNLSEFVYTPRYSITVSYKDLGNVAVYNSSGPIPFSIKQDPNGGFVIDITFNQNVIGKDKVNSFNVSFSTKSIATKKGSVWEVNVPGISQEDIFDSYIAILEVPDSFGTPSIVKPWQKLQGKEIIFDKSVLVNSGILILFGDTQKYNVSLKYNLTNANLFPVKTEIALPPSTNYQDVVVKNLSEKPINVYKDDDGNWLAEYKLLPNQKKEIKADLQITIYSSPKEEVLSLEDKEKYTSPKQYWESNNQAIREIAKTLSTPQDVYKYVVDTLSYDYKKINSKNNRLGALKVLENKNNAVCLEFDDLFIALMRAKGIPARSVEGFAYTLNEKMRPVSLEEDILHAWPEYYDEEQNTWIMVDPTWGNTTGGIDYFNTLDFDHLTFVRKGVSSTYPIPAGGYKTQVKSKDVEVSFADSQVQEIRSSDVSIILPLEAISLFPVKGSITLTNTGNVPISNKIVKVNSQLNLKKNEFKVDYLPPYGSATYSLNFEKTPFLTNKAYEVKILFDGKSAARRVFVRTIPGIGLVALGGGLLVGSIIFTIITFKTRRVFVQK